MNQKNTAFLEGSFNHNVKEYSKGNIGSPAWNNGMFSIEVAKRIIDGTIPIGSKILDVGCGHGQQCIMFAINGMRVTGIDIIDQALTEAKKLAKLYGVDIAFKDADILNMPFADNSFDFVHDRFVFHSICPDKRSAYAKEICRVLKVGGAYMMTGFSNKMKSGPGPIRLSGKDIINTFDSHLSCEHLELINGFSTQKKSKQIHWFTVWRK